MRLIVGWNDNARFHALSRRILLSLRSAYFANYANSIARVHRESTTNKNSSRHRVDFTQNRLFNTRISGPNPYFLLARNIGAGTHGH